MQTWFETVFDSIGKEIVSREYTRLGKIRSELFIDPEKNRVTGIYYHENGLVSEISYQQNFVSRGHYIRYDSNGLPSRETDHDENGKELKVK